MFYSKHIMVFNVLYSFIFLGLITSILGRFYQHGQDQAKQTVQGKHDVSIVDYPFVVTLIYEYVEHGRLMELHFCAGAIIHPQWVVTADFCFGSQVFEPFYVGAGSTKAYENARYAVKRTFVYDREEDHYGIALIQLESAVDCKYCQPISISSYIPEESELITVLGWANGTDIESLLTENLQAVQIPVITHEKCEKIYSSYDVPLRTDQFCAGYLNRNASQTCSKEEGAPAIFNNELVGIVAWGNDCLEPNTPGIYLSTAHYIAWITKITKIKST